MKLRFLIAGVLCSLATGCLGPGTLLNEPCLTDGPTVIEEKCLSCHSASKIGAARSGAPNDVNFDTEPEIIQHADKIREWAIDKGLMPPTRPLASCNRQTLEQYLDQIAPD